MTDISIGSIEGTGVQIGNGNTQTVTAETAAEAGTRAHEAMDAAAAPGSETERAEDAADEAETLPAPAESPIEVTPEEKIMQEFAGAKPLSISVKISDNDKTFAIKVKRGMGATAEVIETFDNLTTDDFRKRIEESKFIVLNDALAQAIILDVSKQRLLKAMAVRHAQIGAEFKETVVDPIKAYEAAKLQTLIVAEDEPEDSGIRASTLERLRVAAEAAQAKLRVFGSVKDKNLGMRLAIMTRSQRTKYWADIHRAEGDRKRKRLANAKRKAKKARRR